MIFYYFITNNTNKAIKFSAVKFDIVFSLGECCPKLVISGVGDISSQKHHSDKFGGYTKHSISNGQHVYKLDGGDYYLHFSSNSRWTVRN